MATFKGVKLHKGQNRIVRGILSSPCRYNIVNAPRQFGKSVMVMQLALNFAINNPNTLTLYTAPVHAQSKKVYKQILNAIIKSGIVKSHNASDQIIELINGSKVQFTGVEKYDNLRGLTVQYMICDEFSFYKREAWTESLRPMLLVSGRKVIIISTPKGKQNLFYEMAVKGMSEDFPNYQYFLGDYLENPFYDKAEIIDARNTLPEYIFQQEYLAKFLSTSGDLFKNIDNCSTIDKWGAKGNRFFAGLDLGRQDDYTVLTIINEKNEVVEVYRDRQKSWAIIINNVIQITKKYNANLIVETNSIGDVIFEMIKKQWHQTYPFVTSNSSKQYVIEYLIVLFQNKELSIPNETLFKPLHEELGTYTYEYNPRSRTVKYTHLNGHHDDCIDSLALALECKTKFKHTTPPINF